ncbi:MAG: DUF445 family protein [Firmicutes bacterium]|nr:DUF445 family protein [Bacillota bacterium]
MLKLISMPIVSALIGWGTNVVAIRMLFWPAKPVRIALLNVELYGALPKRQKEIARSIGEIVNNELLPVESLMDAINTKEMHQHLAHLICSNIESKLERFLPRFLHQPTRGVFDNLLVDVVTREIADLFTRLGKDLAADLQAKGLLGKLVEEKISSYDISGLEALILQVAHTELRYIELAGGALGFIIGLVQAAIVYWL